MTEAHTEMASGRLMSPCILCATQAVFRDATRRKTKRVSDAQTTKLSLLHADVDSSRVWRNKQVGPKSRSLVALIEPLVERTNIECSPRAIMSPGHLMNSHFGF